MLRVLTVLMLILPSISRSVERALIVGNDIYTELPSLIKAQEDANGYTELFTRRGYQVTTVLNAPMARMQRRLAEFYESIQPDDTVVFIYSGHGWSDGTQNFLVPTDAEATNSLSVAKSMSIPLKNGVNGILDNIAARQSKLTISIIDACRNNPFGSNLSRAIGVTRGLAPIEPAEGTFLIYSAGAGQLALDRLGEADTQQYSVFTRFFLRNLDELGDLRNAIIQTRSQVQEAAGLIGANQRPAYYDELSGVSCLFGSCSSTPTDLTTLAQPLTSPSQAEVLWGILQYSDDEATLNAFVERFQDSDPVFAELAKLKMEGLESKQSELETTQATTEIQLHETPVAQDHISRDIPIRMEREQLKSIQAKLNQLGYDTGYIDGILGRITSSALIRFQTESGLTPSGEINSGTLAALGFSPDQQTDLYSFSNEISLDLSSGQVINRVRQLQNEAWQFHLNGDFFDGVGLYEEARLLALTYFGPNSELYANANNAMGGTLSSMGRKTDAIEAFQTSIRINLQIGSNPISVANDQANLAAVLGDLEQYEDAVTVLNQAISTMENNQLSSAELSAYSAALQTKSRFLLHQNNEAEALSAANLSVKVLQTSRSTGTKQYADALANRAQLFLETGDCVSARSDFELSANTMRAARISDSHQDFIYRTKQSKMACSEDGMTVLIDFPFMGRIVKWTYYFAYTTECENDLTAQITLPNSQTVTVMEGGLHRCSGTPTTFISENDYLTVFKGDPIRGKWQFTIRDLGNNNYTGTLDDVWIKIVVENNGVVTEHQVSATGLPLPIPNPG